MSKISNSFFLGIFSILSVEGSVIGQQFSDFFVEYKIVPIKEKSIILSSIKDIDFDDHYNIWIIDYNTSQVAKFDSNGNLIKIVANKGNGPGEVFSPQSIFVTSSSKVFVANILKRISQFDVNGKFINAFITIDGHPVTSDILVDKDSTIWVGGPRDSDKTMIHVYNKDRKYQTSFCPYDPNIFGKNLTPYRSVYFCQDDAERLYVVQPVSPKVSLYDKSYNLVTQFGVESKFYREPGFLTLEIIRDDRRSKDFGKTMTYITDVFWHKNRVFVLGRNMTNDYDFTYFIDIYDAISYQYIGSVESEFRLMRVKNGVFVFRQENLMREDVERAVILCRYQGW